MLTLMIRVTPLGSHCIEAQETLPDGWINRCTIAYIESFSGATNATVYPDMNMPAALFDRLYCYDSED